MDVKIFYLNVYPYHGVAFSSKINYGIEVRDEQTNDMLWCYCNINGIETQAIDEQLSVEWLLSQWRLINPNIVESVKVKTSSYPQDTPLSQIRNDAYTTVSRLG